MTEFYVSIKGSLGFSVYADKIIHQKSYYSLCNDIYVCFQINDKTTCRIPQRIIQEIKRCHLLNESEIIYSSN